MRDPFANYDNWLERPYQDMIEESDRFFDWAEEEGYDLDDPAQEEQALADYEDYIQSCYEDEAEAKYEAYLDRMEMEAEERDESW